MRLAVQVISRACEIQQYSLVPDRSVQDGAACEVSITFSWLINSLATLVVILNRQWSVYENCMFQMNNLIFLQAFICESTS